MITKSSELQWYKARDAYHEPTYGYVIDKPHNRENWLMVFDKRTRKYDILYRGSMAQCLRVAEIHAVQHYPL